MNQRPVDGRGKANAAHIHPIPNLVHRAREVQDLIAERTYKLYRYDERRTDDLEEWLKAWVQAESEVLCPVVAKILQTPSTIEVELNIPGFLPSDLRLSIDSLCLAVSGEKTAAANPQDDGKQPVEQVFQVITLPCAVQPSGMLVSFSDGTLRLSIPKKEPKRAASQTSPPPFGERSEMKLQAALKHALLLLA